MLPTFVRLARFAPVTPIVGPGTQRLQPIWVEDVAEYYSRSLELPEAAGRTFEIGGPDAPTWNEFWGHLKRVLGSRRPSVHIPFAAMRLQAALDGRLDLDRFVTRTISLEDVPEALDDLHAPKGVRTVVTF